MASVIHIAEIAALLAAAYVVGWTIGYFARHLTARPAAVATIPAVRLAAVTGEGADALVKAPIIAPVANDPPPPVPPAPIVGDPQPVLAEEPPVSPAPAVEVVAEPVATTLPPVAIAEIIAPPVQGPAPETAVPLAAAPASKPGEAWAGEINGRASQPFEVAATADAVFSIEPVIAEPIVPEPSPIALESSPIEDIPEPVHDAAQEELPSLLAASPPPPEPPAYDEGAAMRAIEGGWSRVRARAMPGAPELSDVGAAVAAAQTAVEQVLAQAGIDPAGSGHGGKPKGLPRPRQAGKDNLRQINGLGALDESTLNNLGVFHFDQIAGWDQAEVLWMENHVFARGRIGREDWQDQARALAAAVAG